MSTQSLVFQNGLVLDSSCACNCDNDVCIRATSGASDQCGSKYWPGHPIELLQNNHVIGKFPASFEDHSVCILKTECMKSMGLVYCFLVYNPGALAMTNPTQ